MQRWGCRLRTRSARIDKQRAVRRLERRQAPRWRYSTGDPTPNPRPAWAYKHASSVREWLARFRSSAMGSALARFYFIFGKSAAPASETGRRNRRRCALLVGASPVDYATPSQLRAAAGLPPSTEFATSAAPT